MLNNNVTIITGAAQGIGLACAQRFVQEGAKVVLSDIQDETGEQAAQQLRDEGFDALYVNCDVSSKSQIQSLFDQALEHYGRIDCVIANAAIVHAADILELEEEDFDRVIRINLKGVFLTGQIAAQTMLRQTPDDQGSRGTIINMSSINSVVTIPAIASYAIAKGGINQWTKSLAIRVAKEGIRVNGIGPGSINTEMYQAVNNDPQKRHDVLARTPMGRPGEPDEIARVAVFLASQYSSYMTGQTVYADGGRLGLSYMVPVDD